MSCWHSSVRKRWLRAFEICSKRCALPGVQGVVLGRKPAMSAMMGKFLRMKPWNLIRGTFESNTWLPLASATTTKNNHENTYEIHSFHMTEICRHLNLWHFSLVRNNIFFCAIVSNQMSRDFTNQSKVFSAGTDGVHYRGVKCSSAHASYLELGGRPTTARQPGQ